MKRSLVTKILIGTTALLTAAVPIATIAWFAGNLANTKDKVLEGEVGLRSYFYAGSGQEGDPYEIVTPIHFYNLTRLQNLGIFSGETWFQIGHVFDEYGETEPMCFVDYDTSGPDPVPNLTPYLDMKSICYGESPLKLLPVGNEGTPFVGHFDGQGIPIRNLKITGYPEDIGVFGYVDYKGTVEGLVLDGTEDFGEDEIEGTADDNPGLEICSLGYNASEEATAFDHQLFSADIDDIFTTAHYFKDAHLDIVQYKYNTSTGQWYWTVPSSLKKANGALGTHLEHLNGSDVYNKGEEDEVSSSNKTGTVYNKAYFIVNTPAVAADRPFTYEWISSSDLIQAEKVFDLDDDGELDETIVIDMNLLKKSPDFQNGSKQASARLSIVANTEVDGYKFSRVIQTYVFEFRSNGDIYEDDPEHEKVSQGAFSVNVYLDYMASPAGAPESDYITNYHHGNNIGFLVGHLNGTLTNSYVYKGKLTFNQVGMTPILTESDTGLVGEIGKNVINSIDPELGIVTNGRIGVMNFTKIYENIREDVNSDTAHTLRGNRNRPEGESDYVNYASYYDFINTENYANWTDYLRKDNVSVSDRQPILKTSSIDMTTSSFNIAKGQVLTDAQKDDLNQVDFIWNKLIENELDEDGHITTDRELGVFKIITSRYDLPEGYDDATQYGSYMLNKIGNSRIINGSKKHRYVYFSTAEYDHTVTNSLNWDSTPPLRGTDLPEEYGLDLNSYDYPFSRDHNYCFQLDLNDMEKAGTNYYMSTTTDPFLRNYLSTKLISDIGKPITSGSNFGFMFARKQDRDHLERLKSLSSYMPVGVPDFDNKFQPDGYDDYYPQNCIAFSILNTFGGNVSVVGNGNDITIYRLDKSSPTKTSGEKALYSMRSTNFSSSSDSHRYFPFDVESGVVSPLNIDENMDTDDKALYGHIFKLSQGDYVIGSRTGTANIYFLAVQGQEKGEIDNLEIADLGYKIENVDFLNERPTYAAFQEYTADPEHSTALKRAGVSFSANFNENQVQTFYVKTKNYLSNPVMWIDFQDGATKFVTYLVTYSEDKKPVYIQDKEDPYRLESVAYRSPGVEDEEGD